MHERRTVGHTNSSTHIHRSDVTTMFGTPQAGSLIIKKKKKQTQEIRKIYIIPVVRNYTSDALGKSGTMCLSDELNQANSHMIIELLSEQV